MKLKQHFKIRIKSTHEIALLSFQYVGRMFKIIMYTFKKLITPINGFGLM